MSCVLSPPYVRGASQPADEDRDAPAAVPARGAPQPASFTVASFNFGFSTHCSNFGRVCAAIVQDADADLLFGCEVGAFRQGLSKAAINVEDILTKPFGDSIRFSEVDNYWSLWGFGGASQPAVVSLHGDTDIYHVPIGRQVDAVITRFDVQTSGHCKVHVVIGNMHIVCGARAPEVSPSPLGRPRGSGVGHAGCAPRGRRQQPDLPGGA